MSDNSGNVNFSNIADMSQLNASVDASMEDMSPLDMFNSIIWGS